MISTFLSKILSKSKKPVNGGGGIAPGGNHPPMGNQPKKTAKII